MIMLEVVQNLPPMVVKSIQLFFHFLEVYKYQSKIEKYKLN